VEVRAEHAFEYIRLQSEVAVPHRPFDDGVTNADDHRCREALRPELRAFRNAARHDGRDRRRECA